MDCNEYPIELFTQKNHKVIKADGLDEKSLLIRRSQTSANEVLDDVGDISIHALIKHIEKGADYADLYEWSSNLLGAFKVEHLEFVVPVKNDQLIKFNSDGSISSDAVLKESLKSDEYSCIKDFLPLSFLVKVFHRMPFPHTKGNTKYETVCLIVHKATQCNYWHFQFTFEDGETKMPIKPSDSTWKKKAAEYFVQSRLKKYVKILK